VKLEKSRGSRRAVTCCFGDCISDNSGVKTSQSLRLYEGFSEKVELRSRLFEQSRLKIHMTLISPFCSR
jgi:hypothetical protein